MSSLYSAGELKKICAQYRFHPSHDRGQNFLIDEKVARETIHAARLHLDDEVIEVGPGFGALTFGLAKQARRVTAVEIEPKLVQFLKSELARQKIKNVEVIERDFIGWLNSQMVTLLHCHKVKRLSIVASLPYSITSDFFSSVLKDDRLPKRLVLILQKEVAERLAARPPYMSLLSVVAQWFGRVEMVRFIPRSAFWPMPAVESALVKIDLHDSFVLARRNGIKSETFLHFIKPAFRFPRRKILNTINISVDLRSNPRSSAFIERRPGELSLDDWTMLYTTKYGAI
ncbi:MAG: 16S rRNA (adenine(1518)-N(6)/adenine(1519)-N(6))-dimethyltransferase RsmA [Patescibacteria group bacterium]